MAEPCRALQWNCDAFRPHLRAEKTVTTDAFSVLKQSRIDEVSRLAATEFGASDWIAGFVSHYFRNVTSKDLFQRSTDDLFQLVKTHYLAGRQRGGAESDAIKLAIYLPYRPSHGWEAGGSTVIQLVMPDSPYIVDSLMLELERQDWAIRDVVHPQFAVHRDRRGVLTSADPLSSGDGAHRGLPAARNSRCGCHTTFGSRVVGGDAAGAPCRDRLPGDEESHGGNRGRNAECANGNG
ncbi:MAG: hypothetical protein CR980_02160 [Propionibacteriales bacterium]|nr:MAG: hypothetical protein CR980_02160 [Propionibacteriales bacterium]